MHSLFPDLPEETSALTPAGAGVPRLMTANRSQLFWRPTNLEELLPEDHLARLIWALVEELDMSAFLKTIAAVEGHQGRPAIDPRLLLAVWVYALSEGVGSARAVGRLCERHDAYRWLLGGVTVNYHTLSDFRWQQPEALEGLFSQLLAAMHQEGLVSFTRVAQDGLRVRASAGDASFRRQPSLEQSLAEAQTHVQRLARELETPDRSASPRQRAAAQRAARERLERVKAALDELPKVREAQKVKDPDEARVSTTDPEARVMKMPDAGFRPAFNVQFASDCGSQVMVGVDVVNNGSDRAQLLPMLDQLERRLGRLPAEVLVDGGYASGETVENTNRRGIILYTPVQRAKRADIDPHAPRPGDSPAVAAWRLRMTTPEAKRAYRDRAMHECVNALARLRGLRCFLLRGLDKVRSMTLLVALTHNLLRWQPLRLAHAPA